MSANLYWQPCNERVLLAGVWAPQLFMETLQALGWDRDGGELNLGHAQGLRALARLYSGPENPYAALLAALEAHGTIRLWPEY